MLLLITPQFPSSRQKLTLKGDKKALSDDDTLAKLGISDGGELAIKDLGPQIGWKTVFLIEYVGAFTSMRPMEHILIELRLDRFSYILYSTISQDCFMEQTSNTVYYKSKCFPMFLSRLIGNTRPNCMLLGIPLP